LSHKRLIRSKVETARDVSRGANSATQNMRWEENALIVTPRTPTEVVSSGGERKETHRQGTEPIPSRWGGEECD